jgi:glutamate synthase domain-containing protein 2
MITLAIVISVILLILVAVAIHDLTQKRDPILRNYPIVGHGRHVLNELGPKLRQYIVANNNEERPFNRDDRDWVYRSADKANNYFGFGTDNDIETSQDYLIIKQSTFPVLDPQPDDEGYDPDYRIGSKKVIGESRGRKGAFRPNSIVNISAMSYGSLSAPAVEAMSRGAAICGCLQNTGEGGVSPHHDHGSDLVWQLGTGYYGARAADGNFDEKRLVETCEKYNVKAIEVKISQGAKPGRGGVLPGSKVTPEIASIRGIPIGKSCLSPNAHRAFSNADQMLDFVERIAELSGLPVGIKSAVGQLEFWHELAGQMESGNRGIDFLAIDGGEGGTGAAPLVFSDHVAMPFRIGFSRVYSIFEQAGLQDRLTFIGSGKLGFPEETLVSMAMGCDMVNVARTAMLAIGCIQAQICHTGKCPTGVATQDKWLMRGLDPTDKSARLANYITTLRKEVLQLCRACGVEHPSEMTLNHFEVVKDRFHAVPIAGESPSRLT